MTQPLEHVCERLSSLLLLVGACRAIAPLTPHRQTPAVDFFLQLPAHVGAESYFIRRELKIHLHRVTGTTPGSTPVTICMWQHVAACTSMWYNHDAKLGSTALGVCAIRLHTHTHLCVCTAGDNALAINRPGDARGAAPSKVLYHKVCALPRR